MGQLSYKLIFTGDGPERQVYIDTPGELMPVVIVIGMYSLTTSQSTSAGWLLGWMVLRPPPHC